MTDQAENRFDSIESAHEYLGILADVLTDTLAVVQDDIRQAQDRRADARQVDALQLVDYKLQRLYDHLRTSRRLLNDLRTLRRLLNGEREAPPDAPPEAAPPSEPQPVAATAATAPALAG